MLMLPLAWKHRTLGSQRTLPVVSGKLCILIIVALDTIENTAKNIDTIVLEGELW